MSKKKEKPTTEEKPEWDFDPTLGYETEPTLTKEEFERLLIRKR